MNAHRTKPAPLAAALLAVVLAACTEQLTDPGETNPSALDDIECEADNAGLSLPAGFCVVIVADLELDGEAAAARHMAVTPAGDVFVAINASRNNQPSFGIVGLRDEDGDGRAEMQTRFSAGLGGSGIAWDAGTLYFGANDRVVRWSLADGDLEPAGAAAVVVSGLPDTGDHISKTVVVTGTGDLFVNIGSASNACQEENREAQSPGVYPCPELPVRAGVWRFDAGGTNQTEADGEHFATGLRNMVALAINPANGALYGVQHGRDMLFENWPQFFTQEDDAELPAEELVRIDSGIDNGWPYCYYDAITANAKLLAPEYGGDGVLVSNDDIDCASFNQPLETFGAHWAPNGIAFYDGEQFPAHYRGGAFIAFHGGFDRAPLPNEGYQVQFVPFGANGTPSGGPEPFADGFAGSSGDLPANALHRPVGVTVGPDGSLYISDDRGGRIYRIIYRGS